MTGLLEGRLAPKSGRTSSRSGRRAGSQRGGGGRFSRGRREKIQAPCSVVFDFLKDYFGFGLFCRVFCNIHFFQASPDGVLSKYKRTTGHKHRGAAKVLESRTSYR